MIDAASASMRRVLTEHHHLEVAFEIAQHIAIGSRHLLGRDTRHLGDDVLDFRHVDLAGALIDRQQALARAGFVDHVDGLVRQQTVGDVLHRQIDGGLQCLVGVFDLVVFLEARLAGPSGSRCCRRSVGSTTSIFWKRRASARSFSKTPRNSWNVVEPMQRSSPEASMGLIRLRRIHRAARRGTGADDGVDLVDEQDRARLLLELADHRLQALLEIAAVLGASDQRAKIERPDRGSSFSTSGTSPSTMRLARPSASAVLPTPASPTYSGLFLRRRHSTWIVRSISSWRPISGSILPCQRQLVEVAGVFAQRIAARLAVFALALATRHALRRLPSWPILAMPCEM